MRRWIQRGVGLGVCVGLLALPLWRGRLVPAEIDGHSMAPTLRGSHLVADCAACGVPLAFAPQQQLPRYRLHCPRCGPQWLTATEARPAAADAVQIDRTAFWFRAPVRWEIVAYQDGDDLFVKRIVGLPQEQVSIRHGDVFINGVIARKSFYHWRQLACEVATGTRCWQGAGWRKQADSMRLSPERATQPVSLRRPRAEASLTPLEWLTFRTDGRGMLRDDIPFNVGLSRRLHTLRDLGVSMQVEGEPPGVVGIRLCDGFQQIELRFQIGRREVTCRLDGSNVRLPSLAVPLSGRGDTLEAALCDAQLWLAHDGRGIACLPFDPPPDRQPLHPPKLAIGGRGHLQITRPRVWRDVFYLPPANRPEFPNLEPGKYFVMGDNCPVSLDSRSPQVGSISANSIIGKVLRCQR